MAPRARAYWVTNTYLYFFTHGVASAAGQAAGAFHGGEIPFVFGSDPGWPVVRTIRV